MDSSRTTEAGSGDTRPRPWPGGGKGREGSRPWPRPPARPGHAPVGPVPSGPAPRPRREGRRAMAAGRVRHHRPAIVVVCVRTRLVSEHTVCSRNHSTQPRRWEKTYKVMESHRNKAFSLRNCKASIYIESEPFSPRGGCILPILDGKQKLSLYISYSQQKERSTFRACLIYILNIAAF